MSYAPPYHVDTVMDATAWTLAGEYAQALMALAPGAAEAGRLGADLTELTRQIDQAGAADTLLCELVGGRPACDALVRRVFGGRVRDELYGLLGVLVRRGRLELLGAVEKRYRRELLRRTGIVQVIVTSAYPLDDDRRDRLADLLRRSLDAEVMLLCRVDPSLLGGIVVQLGDTIYDASLAGDLDRLRRRLRDRAERANGDGLPALLPADPPAPETPTPPQPSGDHQGPTAQ